jgi:energy-coupling factor transporter ATP-binding protein EcfA2
MRNLLPAAPAITSVTVPLVCDKILVIEAVPGEVTTIVGANGAGKSALATLLAAQIPPEKRRRVLAQRKIWFQNSGPNISASGRESVTSNMNYWDTSPDSRFVDHADGQRTDVALFDLLGKIAAEDHRIAELSQIDRRSPEEIDAIVGDRLFQVLNSVLERAGLTVLVKTTDKQTFAAVHRTLGTVYPIAQMSDGERSALLLAAEVLIAPENSIVIMDEPERHLHRSVSAGLIEALIDARNDCSFVVLTHDLDLALVLSVRPGRVFASLAVEWNGNEAVRWDLEEVTTDSPLTEAARRAILGGRRRVLFIEGEVGSLDYSLYSLLFPSWTIAASGNCEWVIRSVEGVRSANGYHWVEAAGIVDGDGRSEQECDALLAKGVHPLKVSEVESLYYLPEVLAAVAAKVAVVDGEDPEERIRDAQAAGLMALASNGGMDRIAKKLATDEISRTIVAAIPTDVAQTEIRISLPSPFEAIKNRLESTLAANDYEGLIRFASIRDSAFRSKVAAEIGFPRFERYQKAALVAVAESPQLLALLRREVAESLWTPEN